MFVTTREKYIVDMAEKGLRVDGRKNEDYREIVIERDFIKTAEGSAKVTIGNTQVVVGVKMSVGTPYADRPDEGVLIVNAELVPMADPDFEPGPPSAEAVEVARVVDRGIRESKMVDLKKLFIDEKSVWMVNVDIHALDHDGNLIDAAALAAVVALSNTMIPKYEDGKITVEEKTKPLPVVSKPVTVTVAKIADKIFVDPCQAEENVMSARLTVSVKDNDNLCSLQKGGDAGFTVDEITGIIGIANEKSKELRKLL